MSQMRNSFVWCSLHYATLHMWITAALKQDINRIGKESINQRSSQSGNSVKAAEIYLIHKRLLIGELLFYKFGLIEES